MRISESLAKIKLAPFATEVDVDEALRLFQVSTLDAAMSGNLAGMYRNKKKYYGGGGVVSSVKYQPGTFLERMGGGRDDR